MIDDRTRLATSTDLHTFLTLAGAYLVELHNLGSEIQPTPNSLSFYQLVFEMVTSPASSDCGVCVLTGDYGFSIASEVSAPMVDTEFGRTAFGHGTYVRPEYRRQGVSKLLRDRVRGELIARGFNTVIGGIHLQNDVAVQSLDRTSFTPYMLLGYERLQ